MEKTKNKFLIGATILLIASIIVKFLGAFYKVSLVGILESYGIGIYQTIFSIFALFAMLSSGGIVVALSKCVANVRFRKNKIKIYLKSAFFLTIFLTGFFASVFLVVTPFISAQQNSESFLICYYAILPCIFLSGTLAVFKGYFLGKNKMSTTAFATTIEQISKVFFSIFFAKQFLKYGILNSIFGALFGVTISEFIANIYYYIIFKKSKKYQKICIKTQKNVKKTQKYCKFLSNFKTLQTKFQKKLSIKIAIKELFLTSFFVTIEASILPLVVAVDGIVVVPLLINRGITSQLAYSLFGISNGVVSSVLNLPIIIASSIGSAIIPNIQNQNTANVTEKVKLSIKLVWIASLAFFVVFLVLPNNIISFLFSGGLSNKMVDELYISSEILKIGAFSTIYFSLLTITSSILQGLGKSQKPAKNLAICAIFRIIFMVFLINFADLSIFAVQIADVLFYGFALLLNIISIKKCSSFKFPYFKTFVLPIFCAGLMILSIQFSKFVFADMFSPKIFTIMICSVGVFSYFVGLIFTKSIDFVQIKKMIFKQKQR